MDLYIDLMVKDTPPVAYRHPETGEPHVIMEKRDTIIARFIARSFVDFRFLDNHLAKPVSHLGFHTTLQSCLT